MIREKTFVMTWTFVRCSTFATLAAAFLFFPTSSATAGMLLEVSDNGTDLFLKWTGSIDLTGSTTTGPISTPDTDRILPGGQQVQSTSGSWYIDGTAGTLSGNDPFIFTLQELKNSPSNGSGLPFGFLNDDVFWDTSFGVSPGIVTSNRSWSYSDQTVASVFGSNLNAGPVLLWTHNGTGDTIHVGLVPEPSTTALLTLGALGLMARCRRR